MPQLINSTQGKQLYSLLRGCYILQTRSNEVGWSSKNKREYVDISGGASEGIPRSFYFEVSEGYLVLPPDESFSIIQLPQAFERFIFEKIS